MPPSVVWRFAVHPLHNPGLLQQRYGSLIEWVNVRLSGVQLQLKALGDCAHVGGSCASVSRNSRCRTPIRPCRRKRGATGWWPRSLQMTSSMG